MRRRFVPAMILATANLQLAQALNPIELDGQDFIDSVTHERFEIIGIAYQPGGSAGFNPALGFDPLSNGTNCMRDVAIMQRLGVNTVRSYNLDPDLNHDECASILDIAGIYMLIDVNSPLPGGSINAAAPASSYDLNYINRTFAIVDAFKDYPNTLGFFGANELIYTLSDGDINPPYVRAVQRDLKSYIAAQSARNIPVGYSAADIRPIVPDMAAYLECQIDSNDNSRSDFFGLNSYSWCGNATLETSGYDDLVSIFGNASAPVFFSEFGCNKVEPRLFTEIPTLFGSQMTVFSGGVVYEYSQEPNNFGLVQINADGTANLLDDFQTLQSQFRKIDLGLLKARNATAGAITPPICAASLITSSDFKNNFRLPSAPPGTQKLIDEGVPKSNKGKIIDISDLNVPVTVFDVGGQPIQNLAITTAANGQGNIPGATATGTGLATSSTSTGATATNAAGITSVGLSLAIVLQLI